MTWNPFHVAILGFEHLDLYNLQNIHQILFDIITEEFQMYADHVTLHSRGMPYGDHLPLLMKTQYPTIWKDVQLTKPGDTTYWDVFFRKYPVPTTNTKILSSLQACQQYIESQCHHFIFVSLTEEKPMCDATWMTHLSENPSNQVILLTVSTGKWVKSKSTINYGQYLKQVCDSVTI